MTTSEVSAILNALSELSVRVHEVMERLARIEERTTVLSDHEVRIRSAEEESRVAKQLAEAVRQDLIKHDVRIKSLEQYRLLNGKFTIGVAGRVLAGVIGVMVSAVGLALGIQQLVG